MIPVTTSRGTGIFNHGCDWLSQNIRIKCVALPHHNVGEILLSAKRLLLVLGAVAAVTAISLPAAADTAAIVAARSDYFHGLGKSFKGLREELKGSSPDLNLVRKYTGDIAAAAPKLPTQFPAGSGPQPGIKTEARAEIWSDGAKFRQAAAALNTAAQTLNTAAQGSDIGAIRTATDALGQTCKTCHMTFRKEDH